jgi:molecular chaperone GrpE (heat shock protein)
LIDEQQRQLNRLGQDLDNFKRRREKKVVKTKKKRRQNK